jgi:hypothetical protein
MHSREGNASHLCWKPQEGASQWQQYRRSTSSRLVGLSPTSVTRSSPSISQPLPLCPRTLVCVCLPPVQAVIIGDTAVGKTAVLNQYCKGRFSPDHKATIGVKLDSKELSLDHTSVTLQMWDTAGQERFDSLAPSYYRGADACVLVRAFLVSCVW